MVMIRNILTLFFMMWLSSCSVYDLRITNQDDIECREIRVHWDGKSRICDIDRLRREQ